MGEYPKQLAKTNCPRCGTTQVYEVAAGKVQCLCCSGRWTRAEFDQEVKNKV